MGKGDYELIAEVIRETDLYSDVRARLASSFAEKLAEGNPRFDRERFMRAAMRHADHVGIPRLGRGA